MDAAWRTCPYGVSGIVVREKEREGAVDGIDVVVAVCRRSEIGEGLGLVGRRRPFRCYRRRGSSDRPDFNLR